MSGGSSFPTDAANSYPSYQEPQNGPWGHTINGQIERTAELNVPFDQNQFQEAKQNGCLPPPCKAYPSWPPPYGVGFIYPSLQKGTQETLIGEERGCFPMASPFIDSEPILPSVNMPADEFQGELYSPSNILNMYNCLNTPQPLSNKCFGYMPYDATYMAATGAQGGQAKGWLDNPLSPVPITSVKQPVAVTTDIPSQVPSDRNENYRSGSGSDMIEKFVSGVRPLQPPSQHLKAVGVNPNTNPNTTSGHTSTMNNPNTNPNTNNGHTSTMNNSNAQNNGHTSTMNNSNANNSNGYPPSPKRMRPGQIEVVEVDVEVDVESDDDQCSDPSWSSLLSCMIKSLRGFLRDLLHPNNQPADEDTLSWLFRNNRPYYLVIFMLLIIISCFLLHSLCGNDSQHVVQLFCIFVVAFLVYLVLPRTKGRDEAQKITALFILSVVIWGLIYKSNM